MVNIWNQYQCMVTFNMSRSASYYESGTGRGMGFRDSVARTCWASCTSSPPRARERILDIAATQFPDGSAYHQYQPLTKRGNNGRRRRLQRRPAVADRRRLRLPEARPATSASWTSRWLSTTIHGPYAQPLLEHLRHSFGFT